MNALDRDGFVKVYRRVYSKIRERLGASLGPSKARNVRATFVDLVAAADHRTGFVAGSIREIADGLDINRKTFEGHIAILADIGEVEVVGAWNQHQEDAGILVVNYADIAGVKTTPPPSKELRHHRAEATPPHPDPRGKTRPEEGGRMHTHLVDAVREALIDVFQFERGQITKVPAGQLTEAAKQVAAVGGVPAEVPSRWTRFKERFGREPAGPLDLAKQWGRCDSDTARTARTFAASPPSRIWAKPAVVYDEEEAR